MRNIMFSFKAWLAEGIFDSGPSSHDSEQRFAWVDRLVDRLFHSIQRLNRTMQFGSVGAMQLTRKYQGFISKIKESRLSDVQLEDIMKRFKDVLDLDGPKLPPPMAAAVKEMSDIVSKYYDRQYGTGQTGIQMNPTPSQAARFKN